MFYGLPVIGNDSALHCVSLGDNRQEVSLRAVKLCLFRVRFRKKTCATCRGIQ